MLIMNIVQSYGLHTMCTYAKMNHFYVGILKAFAFASDLLLFTQTGCELVFAVFVMYYLIEEALEIKSMGLEYFRSFWNCMDICVIGVSIKGNLNICMLSDHNNNQTSASLK